MSNEVPNVYLVKWQGTAPKGAPSTMRLYIAPVVGGDVLLPMYDGGLSTRSVISVTPIGYAFNKSPNEDDYAADLVLNGE